MNPNPVSTTDRIGETLVRRWLDPQRRLSLAAGDFAPILRAYEEHVKRWELPQDGLSHAMMREGLAAFGLHLATRPPSETLGITLNIHTPPLNLFLTGDAGARTLTGRAFTEDVQTATSSRLFVQAFRPETGHVQSTMDLDGLDVLRVFEDYYARSEQFPARFLPLDGDRFGLVRALPDGGRERLETLTEPEAVALFGGPLDLIEEKPLRFRCGCSPEKIVRVLRQIFAGREDELFLGDRGVEAFCPRCGARWWIERAAYDAAPPPDAGPDPV